MSLTNAAASILAGVGQDIVFRREGEEPLTLAAAVSDYGLGYPPSSWPSEAFRGQARHAAFRILPADLPLQDGMRLRPLQGDVISWQERDYTIRTCAPEPATYGSAGPMWWVCMAVSEQRGKY